MAHGVAPVAHGLWSQMTHLGVLPVFRVPSRRLPADQGHDPASLVDQDVFGAEIGVGKLQDVRLRRCVDDLDFFLGKVVWLVTSSLELLERLDRKERANPARPKSMVKCGAESGISDDTVLGRLHLSQLLNKATQVPNDLVLLVGRHSRPRLFQRLSRIRFVFDQSPLRPVVHGQHLVAWDRGMSVDQLQGLVFGVEAVRLEDSGVAQPQDGLARGWIRLFLAPVHAPFEAEGDLVVLVVRLGVIAAEAKWHDCGKIFGSWGGTWSTIERA